MSLRRKRVAVAQADRRLTQARARLADTLVSLEISGRDALTPVRIVGAGFALGALSGMLRPWATVSGSLALLTQSLRGARSLTEFLTSVADLSAAPPPSPPETETHRNAEAATAAGCERLP